MLRCQILSIDDVLKSLFLRFYTGVRTWVSLVMLYSCVCLSHQRLWNIPRPVKFQLRMFCVGCDASGFMQSKSNPSSVIAFHVCEILNSCPVLKTLQQLHPSLTLTSMVLPLCLTLMFCFSSFSQRSVQKGTHSSQLRVCWDCHLSCSEDFISMD